MNNKILSVVLIIEIIMYVMVKNPSDDINTVLILL